MPNILTTAILLAAILAISPTHGEQSLKGDWKASSVKCSGAVCEAAKGLRCKITEDSITAKYGENTIRVQADLPRR